MSKRVVVSMDCDLCGRPNAKTWRLVPVAGESEMREIELCSSCEKPLKAIYAKARPRRKISADVVKPPSDGPRRLRSVGG